MATKVDFLKQLYQSSQRTDFVINFNGCSYSVHLALIALKSIYFQSIMLDTVNGHCVGSVDINLELISQEVFQTFLQLL
jgi:hypothetical protein